ncbi:MAG: OmpA family protein [Stenotrophobium sp.]
MSGGTDYTYKPMPTFYVGGYYLHPDSRRGTTKRGTGWTIGAGLPLTQYLTGEITAFTSILDTGAAGTTDFYQRGGGLDLKLGFRRQDQFDPFFLWGIGAIYDDVLPKADKKTSLYYNAGLGFTQPLFGNPWTRLRGDARYIRDRFDGGRNDWRVGLALEVSLGRVLPVEHVVIKDVQVPAEVVPMPVPPPAAQAVDSDGDGVPDDRDLCPNTIRGARVDEHGCVIESQTVTLRNLEFDFNSAHLRPSASGTLDEAVNFMRSQPNVTAQIAGHTDSIGSAAANLKLSRNRANAVKDYLTSHGVEASRLKAVGYGKARPVATNKTEAGRQENRRVEFIITAGAHQ